MNLKYWLVSLLAFALFFIGAGIINGIFLFEDWFAAAKILRDWEPSGDGTLTELQLYHYMVVPYALYGLGTVWFYARTVTDQPWLRQGTIFGLMMSLVTILPMRLLNYTTFRFTTGGKFLLAPVLMKEITLWILMLVVISIVIAWFYRKDGKAST